MTCSTPFLPFFVFVASCLFVFRIDTSVIFHLIIGNPTSNIYLKRVPIIFCLHMIKYRCLVSAAIFAEMRRCWEICRFMRKNCAHKLCIEGFFHKFATDPVILYINRCVPKTKSLKLWYINFDKAARTDTILFKKLLLDM